MFVIIAQILPVVGVLRIFKIVPTPRRGCPRSRPYAVKRKKTGSEHASGLDFDCLLACQCALEPHGAQIQGGVQACAEIRKFSAVPVLFLTAKSQLTDKADAYASGGDDYLPKPFSQAELLLKVESLTRRYRVYKGKQESGSELDITLDESRGIAIRSGQKIDLTGKEFAILRFFFQNQGKTLDVQTVYEGVWGEKFMPSSNNTVMVHILILRKKLESDPANPRLIRTVWGKGYQFG